jgi:hypothetical protein
MGMSVMHVMRMGVWRMAMVMRVHRMTNVTVRMVIDWMRYAMVIVQVTHSDSASGR